MKSLIFRFICIYLLVIVVLTGCASRGSEFLGKWVNTKNPSDTFQITRNGDEYLIVGPDQKPPVGAVYKDGTLEVKAALLSADLTYVKRTDTILTPGFWGQVEYSGRNDQGGTTQSPNLSGPAQRMDTRQNLRHVRYSLRVQMLRKEYRWTASNCLSSYQ